MSYIRLKNGDTYLYPEMYGIDTTNVIASGSGEWTATQDCIFQAQVKSGSQQTQIDIRIDGVVVAKLVTSSSTASGILPIFVKKGQVCKSVYSNTKSSPYTVYGLKYHS